MTRMVLKLVRIAVLALIAGLLAIWVVAVLAFVLTETAGVQADPDVIVILMMTSTAMAIIYAVSWAASE